MQLSGPGFVAILVVAILVALVFSVFVIARNSQKSANTQKQMAETLAKIAEEKKPS